MHFLHRTVIRFAERGLVRTGLLKVMQGLCRTTLQHIVFVLGCPSPGCSNNRYLCYIYHRHHNNVYPEIRSPNPSAAWGTSINSHKDESYEGDHNLIS